MKFFLPFIATLFFFTTSFAQDSLIIKHNGKILYSNLATEDSSKNTIVIDKSDAKEDYLFLTFSPKAQPRNWTRTITVNDDKDRVIFQKQSNGISVPGIVLKEWAKKLKSVSIYTWSSPNDPNLKATVHVRRVHLCTLVFD